MTIANTRHLTDREAILLRLRIEGECWIWTGSTTANGYGQWERSGRREYVHRASYRLFVGPLLDGQEVDHLCRNRACANPSHLEQVTHRENLRRGVTATKTHCINGHRFDEANTRITPDGRRDCRACGREKSRRYYERRKLSL